MRQGDLQKGFPNTLFVASKAAIEALTGVPTGSEAYANNNPTAPYGTYNGVSWDWQPLSSHAAVTLDANADTLLSLSTQTLGLDTQAANTVLAGRLDAGAALVPTFRALVAADIPSLSGTYEVVDATIVRTGQANWIDLTDGGATTLHSHAGGGGDISGTGVVGQVAEFVTDTKTLQAAKIIGPVTNILTLTNAAASTLALAITSAKTLTLTATDNFNLTIPATGTAALLATANVFTTTQTITPGTDVVGLVLNKPTTVDNLQIKSGATVYGGLDNLGRYYNNLDNPVTCLFIGGAGKLGATGVDNFGMGKLALSSLTNGTLDFGIGYSAGKALTTGVGNIMIGQYSTANETDGSSNTNIGAYSGRMQNGGNGNTSIGSSANYYNVTGDDNTSVGREAGRGVPTYSHNNNVFIGTAAGFVIRTGTYNVIVGSLAGQTLSTTGSNIFIGGLAGYQSIGSRNIIIGYYTGYYYTTQNDILTIDNRNRSSLLEDQTYSIINGVMGATPSVQTLRFNAISKVAVNTTTTNAPLVLFDLNAYVSTAATGFANGGGVAFTMTGETATDETSQLMAKIAAVWVDATNGSRKASLKLSAYDTAARLGLEIEATGTDVTLLAYGKLAFTQTDLNEYIDSLNDGYMDYRATTGHRFGDGTNQTVLSAGGSVSFAGTARINWTKITAASVTITAGGTDASSVVADLQTENDGNIFHLDEAAATPGLDFYIEFTSVTAFNWVQIRAAYAGSSTHAISISLYDWVATAWKNKNALQDGEYDATAQQEVMDNLSFFIPSDTVFIGTGGDAGKVRVRFVHPTAGNLSHDVYVDVVSLYR